MATEYNVLASTFVLCEEENTILQKQQLKITQRDCTYENSQVLVKPGRNTRSHEYNTFIFSLENFNQNLAASQLNKGVIVEIGISKVTPKSDHNMDFKIFQHQAKVLKVLEIC